MNLMESLWPYIDSGDETPRVEFKRSLDLSQNKQKAEFAKDVSALANTSGGDGYLIIGVADRKDCPTQSHEGSFESICGVPERSLKEIGILERQMNKILETYCSPSPSVGYEQVQHKPGGKWIGVVTIPRSSQRPHVIIRSGEGIRTQDIWVRRGEHDAACFKANRAELEEMFAGCSAGLVYVSAFPDFATFKNFLSDVAWDTEVWLAEMPDHLIHYNGDRFLGPRG